MLVFLFHLSPHFLATPGLAWIQQGSKFGFFGVDIFFVLSGIVVGNVARATKESGSGALEFAYRRLTRIYVGYWPALIVTVCISTWLFHKSFSLDLITIKSALLLTPTVVGNILPTAWSLTFEIYFYVLVVIVYFAAYRFRTLAIALLLLAFMTWNGYWFLFQKAIVVNGDQPIRFFLSAFCIEFFAGVLLAELWAKGRLSSRYIPGAFGVALISLYAATTTDLSDRVEIVRVCTFGIAAFCICYVALASERVATIVRPKSAFEWLGDCSYSFYLLHPVLLDLAGYSKGTIARLTGIPPAAVLIAQCIAIVLFCGLWFARIERPAFALSQSLLSSSHRKTN